jgi:hypothetical protein
MVRESSLLSSSFDLEQYSEVAHEDFAVKFRVFLMQSVDSPFLVGD